MKVDIIIPIFNAYEDLQMCLESIYRHTDFTDNRLILINDNSTDERIRPYLDCQKKQNVIVIHNEENRGFAGNVNIGMAQSSDRDVILLNSDTIVTRKWVEKMSACAYSDRSIGTVTPLSNNATLCSIPVFCQENQLPKGLTVDETAAIVEECSMCKYPRITVANGFCMLIKREVIDLVGNFDEETFGRGYGEENDFCCRAEQMGYIHVMCDNTYIYHSGTKSFISKEKEVCIREHERILRERYPVQMHMNDLHCRDNPNGWVMRNVAYHFDIQNGKKNLLYLLQADFKEGAENNIGGTQLHVKHLAQALRKDINIYVAARDREFLQVTLYTADREHTFRFHIGKKEPFPVFHRERIAKVIRLILIGFRIDLVHVHHTAFNSLDIFYEAYRLGIPIIYTVHDFYCLCPTVKLLNSEGRYCNGEASEHCRQCLDIRLEIHSQPRYLDYWRSQYLAALNLCTCIVLPSESTAKILCQHYPELSGKMQVIVHGMDSAELVDISNIQMIHTNDFLWEIDETDQKGMCVRLQGTGYLKSEPDQQYKIVLQLTDQKGKSIYFPTNFDRNEDVIQNENRFYAYLPNNVLSDGNISVNAILVKEGNYYICKDRNKVLKNVSFRKQKNFKVAFIGGISEEKGGKIIARIIRKGASDIEWYVFGGIGEENLFQMKRSNLTKTGYYYQEDLYTLIHYHRIDAICLLSGCPETFSYTLSEALLCHIPVIATNIGALGERVSSGKYGALVSADKDKTADEVLQVINKWKKKDSTYQAAVEAVKKYNHTSIAQMVFEYKALYKRFGQISHHSEKLSEDQLEELYHAYMAGEDSGKGEEALLVKIAAMEERLQIIDNSITFRIVREITGMRIPFKGKIRAFLKKNRG